MFYFQNISLYISFGGGVQGGCTWSTLHFCSLVFKNTENVQEHDLYFNQILYHFDLKKNFLRWIIKSLQKGAGGPAPISLRSEHSISHWFHTNTPNSRHLFIQIVNTNNTNVYLIHFHSKNNIQMCFPQSWVFKVSNPSQSSTIHRNAVKWIALTSAKTSQQCISVWFKKKTI